MNFYELLKNVKPADAEAIKKTQKRLNYIAKPVGSLGELENLLLRIAGLTGTDKIDVSEKAVVTLAADNGVTRCGVAMTPPEITAVMTDYIANRRSAVCIMAKCAGADSFCVDMGMFSRIENANLIDRRIAYGTKDMSVEPAMTRAQAEQAISTGIEIVKDLKEKGYKLIATGEMGIGNTTTSSAVVSVLLGMDPEKLTGRGVGLTDEGLQRKVNAIKSAIAVNKPDPSDAVDVLAKVGGFDIAGMCGMFLGGIIYRVPVLIDGLISSAAALAAKRICGEAVTAMLPSHLSAEPAAMIIMNELGLSPVIHAGMRLGEGTGAVAVMPLIDMAVRVYYDLFTYGDLGM